MTPVTPCSLPDVVHQLEDPPGTTAASTVKSLDIVDTASLAVVKSVPVGRAPHNVYCTPDGRWMIATSMGDDKLTAIDIKTESPAFEIPLPGQPRPLVIDRETR